ncbi:hypothetical protein [Synechococcus sp. A15-60]|uniref:OB-fold protein n=1 Tax=Synechococcus sp. A15-60 TaxID=1050655 RepID=UPI001647057C|nr:hypothetical protein [Synechococcus sp. A15-60]QNI47306.1 tRNA_anti-like family protein [Synechococcus sp. A15-60]
MKTALGILTVSSLLLTTGCAELQELAEEYKADQATEEAKENRIRTLDIDQPIANVSVEEIAEEFEANSVVAEDRYMNQPVEITGYIGSIDDSMFDEKNVSITITGGEYSFSSVSCSKPRNAPEVHELRKGMHVAVRGVITSEEMGIRLSRCKFWSFSKDRWIGSEQTTPTHQAPNSFKYTASAEQPSQKTKQHQTRQLAPMEWSNLPRGCSFYFAENDENQPLVWATFPVEDVTKSKAIINVVGGRRELEINTYKDLEIITSDNEYQLVISMGNWRQTGHEMEQSVSTIKVKHLNNSYQVTGIAKRGC